MLIPVVWMLSSKEKPIISNALTMWPAILARLHDPPCSEVVHIGDVVCKGLGLLVHALQVPWQDMPPKGPQSGFRP